MDKLVITACLNTPIVTRGGYWTLDGLLAAVLFDQCNNVKQAHNTLPLRGMHGLFHADGR